MPQGVAGSASATVRGTSDRRQTMRYFRTGLLVLAMVLVLANGPAQAKAKSAPKPKSPTCGGWEVVYSPSPNGNGYLTAVEAVPGTTELWAVGIYNANFHWQTLIEHY